MSLLPKSIHRCRRYPTKFNSGRDIPLFEMAFPNHEEEHHIFPLFADAFKVSLGAIIDALSQWAHQEFAKRKEVVVGS